MHGTNHTYDCRLYERISVSVPGQIFVQGEEGATSCTVLNLAGSGARIRTEKVFSAFGAIVLYVEGFGRFDCITIPRNGELTAVHFIMGPENMKAYLEILADYKFDGKVAPSRLRRHPRTSARGNGHFRRMTGQLVSCDILDVSQQGISLKTELRPSVGEIISVGPTRGRVVRHHSNGIGVFFLNAHG
jgi:hypothetical protein